MKAIADATVFTLALVALFLISGIVIVWRWYSFQSVEASETACKAKYQSYCLDLLEGKDTKWDELSPKTGCEKFDVYEPNLSDCKKVFGG